MNEILFAGNVTRDIVLARSGDSYVYWGGTALTAALAARALCNQVGILSRFGRDFPLDELQDRDIWIAECARSTSLSPIYYADEGTGEAGFVVPGGEAPWIVPRTLAAKHLHISCKRGVDVARIAAAVACDSRSCDVMWLSMAEMVEAVMSTGAHMHCIFCNEVEFDALRARSHVLRWFEGSQWFVTNSGGAVRTFGPEGETVEQVPSVRIGSVVLETGAGDAFIGGVLAARSMHMDLRQSLRYGIALAQAKLGAPGAWHLQSVGPSLGLYVSTAWRNQ